MTEPPVPDRPGRGRPKRTSGNAYCDRCGRVVGKHRVHWPGERLCNSCFYIAMRTYGRCPICDHDGVLPARARANDPRPCCLECGGVNREYFQCRICGQEGEIYRRGQCARCSLRDSLEQLAPPPRRAAVSEIRNTLIQVLTQVQRPESVLTWMRNKQVSEMLHGLMTGSIPCTHDSLDKLPRSKTVEHFRSILEQHDLLEPRDHYLALFERWLDSKESAAATPEVWAVAHRFATWHHLRRLRTNSRPGQANEGPVRSAKQEVTEVIKFLNWLDRHHGRTVELATQQNVDEYLREGPTTRHLIRTFFVWCRSTHVNESVTIKHRSAMTAPKLTDEQRLQWIPSEGGTQIFIARSPAHSAPVLPAR